MNSALSGRVTSFVGVTVSLVAVITLGSCKSDSTAPPVVVIPIPSDTTGTASAFGKGWSLLANSPVTFNANSDSFGHFMDASFITQNEGWIVGISGEMHHTTDGGATWTQLHPGSSSGTALYRSVVFINPMVGFIGDLNNFSNPAPNRALYKTVDGGVTLTNITSTIVGPQPVGLCGMWSVDGTSIFAVGRWNGPAVFVRSTDAGATWQSMSLAPMLTGAVDVYFVDKLHGIIAGARGDGNTAAEQLSSRAVVLGTDDGGNTWKERYVSSTTGHRLWKISFPTPTTGYIAVQGAASDRFIIKTIDGGLTWTELPIPTNDFGFDGAGFISENVGWIGADTVTFETVDGGKTWAKAHWDRGEDINRFRIFPSGVAYAVGKHIFKYTPPT
ncbi:MAG: YCF48-related protein [Gemmatimonadales bacterium]